MLKDVLRESALKLKQDFDDKVHIKQLLSDRSATIDYVVSELWDQTGLNELDTLALIAVGGYGRAEMHPASDVDLLILLQEEPDSATEAKLSDFLTNLWDLGLEVGHSVRTVPQCVEEAEQDLTVITNLIESRHLTGNEALFSELERQISPDKLWPADHFFEAKIQEKHARYQQYGDTAYRVEPNLKEGPGGLRDIQTIDWVTERAYNIRLLHASSDQTLLTPKELQTLVEGKHFLWTVRFALHILAERKEDRLLFDYQRSLAHIFGYTDDTQNQSVERFMQRYYRTITELERLNEVLLGVLRKRILPPPDTKPFHITPLYLNDDDYLAIANPYVFKNHPHTLLSVFYTLQVTPELKGLTPDTIRELRNNLHLIDDNFRAKAKHKQIFMDILNESSGITFVMRRMNRYGVLAAYIPAFANIVGRMQYDLFHAFTVDDHTLNLVQHIRQLGVEKGRKKTPFLSEIFTTLNRPQLLYLAALFHDIAKGRPGSHSELGAIDALEFCKSHGLNEYDSNLVSWLVRQHLTMSTTAQRKDISDPKVIQEFADIVALQSRLDYLYLLTICDIRSTNPTLLTDWKNALLRELYQSTRNYLQQSESASPSAHDLLIEKKNSAIKQLAEIEISAEDCQNFWDGMSTEYLLQHSVDLLVWHIAEIHQANTTKPIIRLKQDEKRSSTQVFIFAKTKKTLFTRIASSLEQMHMNIVAANLATNDDGYSLDTLTFLNTEGKPVTVLSDQQTILRTISKNLLSETFTTNPAHYRVPRKLKYFDTPTRVTFGQNETKKQTVLTLYTSDFPGLLTRISQVFYNEELLIHSARISTLGEEVEDIFYITTLDNQQITDEQKQQQIRESLQERMQQLWK